MIRSKVPNGHGGCWTNVRTLRLGLLRLRMGAGAGAGSQEEQGATECLERKARKRIRFNECTVSSGRAGKDQAYSLGIGNWELGKMIEALFGLEELRECCDTVNSDGDGDGEERGKQERLFIPQSQSSAPSIHFQSILPWTSNLPPPPPGGLGCRVYQSGSVHFHFGYPLVLLDSLYISTSRPIASKTCHRRCIAFLGFA